MQLGNRSTPWLLVRKNPRKELSGNFPKRMFVGALVAKIQTKNTSKLALGNDKAGGTSLPLKT